jgi:hypothetical protein
MGGKISENTDLCVDWKYILVFPVVVLFLTSKSISPFSLIWCVTVIELNIPLSPMRCKLKVFNCLVTTNFEVCIDKRNPIKLTTFQITSLSNKVLDS